MKKHSDILLALIDISFKQFVTPRLIGLVYILGVIFCFVHTVQIVAQAYSVPGGTGSVVATFSPVIFVFYVLVLRIVLEVLLALFKSASGYSEPSETPAAMVEKEVVEAIPEQ